MDAESPRAAATRLIGLFRVSRCIAAGLDLGLFELMRSGSKTDGELAEATGTSRPHLRRLLRVLTAAEVAREDPDGRFGLTPIGEELTDERLGPYARFFLGDPIQRSWLDLTYSIRTGNKAFDHVHGQPLWQFYQSHPGLRVTFDAAMQTLTSDLAQGLVDAFDFGRFGTIIDVGGGEGALLESILTAHPGTRGILFDLPQVVERAGRRIAATSLASRIQIVGGDFQNSVPSGGDAYILKSIVHNWPDEGAVKILNRVRDASGVKATLVVIERVLPESVGPDDLDPLFADILMMLVGGGRERTEADFAELFRGARFRLIRTVDTDSQFSILEGAPLG